MVGEPPFEWESLAVWDAASAPSVAVDDPLSAPVDAPFPVSAQLNAKISLWRGPLYRLRVDAVVNSTCESMRESDGDFGKLLQAAGSEIAIECEAAGTCRTGDAVLTRGCQLPANSFCTLVLTVAKENGLRSVAIGCVYTQRKGYPREEAAHIAVRTVRRYLEHYVDDFDRVILCMSSTQDTLVYEKILPFYFPRSIKEEKQSQEMLATRELGDSFGEPIIVERKIRIGNLSNSSFVDTEHRSRQYEFKRHESNNQPEETGVLFHGAAVDGNIEEADDDIQAFQAMLTDPDAERLDRLQQMQEKRQRQAEEAAIMKQKRLDKATASTAEWDYLAALQRARTEDFSDLKALEFCYCGGVDLAGLPVIVYLAGKVRVEHVDLERELLFVLLTLDSQHSVLSSTSAQFSLLYVQSDVTNVNQPPASWIRRLFRVFTAVAALRAPSEHDKAEESALRFLYVLEPTFGLKFQLLLSKGYCDSGGLYNRVVYLPHPAMLDNIAPTLQLPPHIYSYVC
ncbi:GDAP2 protein isoform X1 [Phytophthora palmivora]|uniref:GDAP2 protein isoform X1 n=1 Tax=Phytophthora palmivora TaxID=4796 RepID=A0A2P4Y872_9STRA|nr:GDAP2 protein isoform X1 [Phytophthora palmivora]